MAKLTKHAEVLNQLHTMVKKQAEEAQKNISGTPGGDVKSVSVSKEHDTTNKNSVGPENVAQGYHQKPSEDPAEPLSASKSASDLGSEILDIIRKQADAQTSVTGAPGDVKSESVGKDKEKTDKNAVKPESNSQDYEQKESKDGSKPLASAKKAEVEELAAKVASYELGRQFCAALLKAAGDHEGYSENEIIKQAGADDFDALMMKEAGRRDFDILIAQAAEELESSEKQAAEEGFDKQAALEEAELAGAAYFDDILKQAALEEAVQENQTLATKLAEYEAFFKQAQAEQASNEYQTKLASSVADIVLEKLKSEVVGSSDAR